MWWDGKNDCDQFSCCTSRPDQLLWQWVGPTLVYSLNQRVCFDMQIWPWASFQLTPSETWVGSRNTSVNLTWPDLEDFGVIPALGRVDSHVRREVAGGLRRADAGQHWIAPGAGGGGWIERWKERELNREGGIMWAGRAVGGKRCDTRSKDLTCEGQVWKVGVVHECWITNRFMCLFFLKLFFLAL